MTNSKVSPRTWQLLKTSSGFRFIDGPKLNDNEKVAVIEYSEYEQAVKDLETAQSLISKMLESERIRPAVQDFTMAQLEKERDSMKLQAQALAEALESDVTWAKSEALANWQKFLQGEK